MRLQMRPSRHPRIVHVFADGCLVFDGRKIRCSLGRSGIVCGKSEGDGATPVGLFPVRRLWFRPDRVRISTNLNTFPIQRPHGWCDAPDHAAYNRPVRLPFSASHENLHRRDGLYDLVLTIGHNDSPPRPGAGSAIFVHVMPALGGPTAGCVAPTREDLAWMLARLRPGDMFRVHESERKSPGFPPRRVLPSGESCVRLPRN
jgi:L,D-peptidoglycan transpeptidase YkuD (ErfK/YbiS/YcfS/YnhG family)